MGLIPDWGTKISCALWCGQKNKNSKKKKKKPNKNLIAKSMNSYSIEDGNSLKERRHLKKSVKKPLVNRKHAQSERRQKRRERYNRKDACKTNSKRVDLN